MSSAKPTAQPQSWLTTANVVWLVFYLLAMGGVVYGLDYARRLAIARFDSPEARDQWQEFRDDMKKVADDPTAPVDRRMPKSAEPPTLRLLRDYFGTCVLLALLLCSALFATFMFMLRGVFGGAAYQPRAD